MRSTLAALTISAATVAIPFLAPEVKATAVETGPLAPLVAVAPATTQSNDWVFTLLKVIVIAGGSTVAVSVLAAFLFRRVVSTNTVHIVQSGKSTVPYGANLPSGNVYYEIPTWVPKLGVSVIKLPVSNFDLSLKDYEAYDKDRVPFLIDVTAFFRISDPVISAKRIKNTEELQHQLGLIVQGAVRKVLASEKIDSIMTQRSTFGDSFSQEVGDQLSEWGIQPVRNMELMDIRDAIGSDVIARIKAKKTSEYEKDSRITVAENNRLAKIAEVENSRQAEVSAVDAEREILLSKQQAEQQVGERTAEAQKAVGVAREKSEQEVLAEKANTKERNLAVRRVEEVRTAEIARDTELVFADKERKIAEVDKQTALVKASQNKETTVLIAEGTLEAERKHAEAIEVAGVAKAKAEEAMQLAPVNAQIALSKEIGSNEPYQRYLALVEAFKAYIAVGSEQAKSLQGADVKVIANGGTASEGVTKVMDLFSSKGGTELAAAVEAFTQSDIGSKLLSSISSKGTEG